MPKVKNRITDEEAYEYYHYNLIGAWGGNGTHVFFFQTKNIN